MTERQKLKERQKLDRCNMREKRRQRKFLVLIMIIILIIIILTLTLDGEARRKRKRETLNVRRDVRKTEIKGETKRRQRGERENEKRSTLGEMKYMVTSQTDADWNIRGRTDDRT